jgi:uncharacterized protein
MNNATITPTERIDVVDALRGFALLGILIVHYLEQYYGGATPVGRENYTVLHPADQVLDGIVGILLRGKFFMLFSFLFGLSFNLQLGRRTYGGEGGRLRFAWRMFVLFVIGFAHHLVYRGDILTVYAMLGLPLLLFYQMPNRGLWILAGVLMFGAPRLILEITGLGGDFQASMARMQAGETEYWAVATGGSWLEMARLNAIPGFMNKMEFQFGAIGRGYQTFALFLLGLYAGRVHLFENIREKGKILRKGMLWSWLLFGGAIAVGAVLFAGFKLMEKSQKWGNTVGMTLYDVSNFALTGVYIFAFLLLARRGWWQRQLLKLAPFGRMALTNYIGQSAIGGAILFGYGFGMLGRVGSSFMLMTGIAVFILQRIGSDWWLRHHYYGPAEWLWRSATLGKWQKFRR